MAIFKLSNYEKKEEQPVDKKTQSVDIKKSIKLKVDDSIAETIAKALYTLYGKDAVDEEQDKDQAVDGEVISASSVESGKEITTESAVVYFVNEQRAISQKASLYIDRLSKMGVKLSFSLERFVSYIDSTKYR